MNRSRYVLILFALNDRIFPELRGNPLIVAVKDISVLVTAVYFTGIASTASDGRPCFVPAFKGPSIVAYEVFFIIRDVKKSE